MKKMLRSNHVFAVLVAICIVSFVFILTTLFSYVNTKNRVARQAKSTIGAESDRLVMEVNNRLSRIGAVLASVKNDIDSGVLKDKDLAQRLENISSADPCIVNSGIVYLPGKDQDAQAVAPPVCYERKDNKPRLMKDISADTYTKEEWFKRAVTDEAIWSEPFFDDNAKTLMTVLSRTVFTPGDTKPAGILFVRVSLSWLSNKMDTMTLEKKAFGIVLSKNGTVIYHPISDLATGQTNIFELLESRKASNPNYENQRAMMQKAVNGETGDGSVLTRSGQSSWYFYRPVLSTGWSIIVSFMRDTAALNGITFRKQQISIALGIIIFITSLAAIRLRLYKRQEVTPRKLWLISIVFSVLCMVTACYTWYLALSIPLNEYQVNKLVVDDQISLNRIITATSNLAETKYGKEAVFIPTGIHIQSLEFSSSSNISLSGYVWQKYTKGVHDEIPRGFVLPESKTFSVTEMYRQNNGEEETIGWYFEAVIRQTLDYSKYPFDHPNISVWLRHKDFIHGTLLAPDIRGYHFMTPSILPGLENRLTLPGYSFSGSFFSLDPKTRNDSFGVDTSKKEMRYPELFFNIIIKRNFITPLISKFFPIFIVISMLFIVMMCFSTDPDKQKSFGLTGLAVVGLVVSFLFSTLLTQVDLRQQFSASGIIFIENFNFITYFVLLLSAVQAFVFVAGKKIWFVQYEHCLISKLIYWPTFTFLILAVSLLYFY